jgi:flagellar protein FlbD
VIALHRITHPDQPLQLNPDLMLTVEAHPDTVVTLTTGSRIIVIESPDEVSQLVRAWRASVLVLALAAPELQEHPDVEQAVSNLLQFPTDRLRNTP